MALVDHLAVLDRIAQNAVDARRKLQRYIDGRVPIQDGSNETLDLQQIQKDDLVTRLRPLVTQIKADASSLPNL